MLREQILKDLKDAMKSGDAKRLGVLRMLSSALQNRKIEKRTKTQSDAELSDEETLEVIQKEAKKRKESIMLFDEGNRADLAQAEKEELEILSAYLPAQMSEADILKAVQKIVASAPVKEFGPVMKEIMKELKGKADAAIITRILKEKLGA